MEEDIFEIFKEYLGDKRKNTPLIDSIAMGNAILWSLMSKDPNTQVGACILGTDNRILSAGYNGTPKAWSDDNFPWYNCVDEIGSLNTKYPYVIHAEMNAITNYRGSIKDLKDSTIYVTLFPCSNCSKLIVQSGIKKVVYLNGPRKGKDGRIDADAVASIYMLRKCGVTCEQFDRDKLKELMSQDVINGAYNKPEPKTIKNVLEIPKNDKKVDE